MHFSHTCDTDSSEQHVDTSECYTLSYFSPAIDVYNERYDENNVLSRYEYIVKNKNQYFAFFTYLWYITCTDSSEQHVDTSKCYTLSYFSPAIDVYNERYDENNVLSIYEYIHSKKIKIKIQDMRGFLPYFNDSEW